MAQHGEGVVAGLCYAYLPRLGIGAQIEHQDLIEVELAGSACLLIKDSEGFSLRRKARAAGSSIWLDTDRPCQVCPARSAPLRSAA